MAKAVIELQKDIINNETDIVSILRKAHLIASKLKLDDFDTWIEKELNGYDCYSDAPEYRTVLGETKAKNPMYGLIPVMVPSEISNQLNKRKLLNPISELIELSKNNKDVCMAFPSEISEALCKNQEVIFQCYFIFGVHNINGIIDFVKNELLNWCIKLEKDGILGEEFEFNKNEINRAKLIPQQINNYGQVINGNVSHSQVVSESNNNIDVNIGNANSLITELKKSLLNEQIDDEKKQEALEIIEDINQSVKSNKKTSIVKSALCGLKDFLINVGAEITASIIVSKMNGF